MRKVIATTLVLVLLLSSFSPTFGNGHNEKGGPSIVRSCDMDPPGPEE